MPRRILQEMKSERWSLPELDSPRDQEGLPWYWRLFIVRAESQNTALLLFQQLLRSSAGWRETFPRPFKEEPGAFRGAGSLIYSLTVLESCCKNLL